MIVINYGVFANLIIVLLIVLLLTDWFKTIFIRLGKTKRIFLYLAITFVLFFVNVSITSFIVINLGGFVLSIIGFVVLLKNEKEKIYILSATFLLGAIYFLIKEIGYIEPVLLYKNVIIQFSILVSLTVIIIGTKIENQVIMILGGIVLGDLLFNLNHKDVIIKLILGNAMTRDIIWLSLFQILIINSFLSRVRILFKKLISISIKTR